MPDYKPNIGGIQESLRHIIEQGVAGGGGSGGATEAQIKNAIETATNLDQLETKLDNQPTAGTPITGAPMPSGGSGQYGWLSAIFKTLTETLAKGQQIMSASLPVAIASNQSAIPIIGFTKSVTEISAGYTRPNDTNAYAANDAVSNSISATTALQFQVGRNNGGSGYITFANCDTNFAQFSGTLRLHLFKLSPAISGQDNDPYPTTQANNSIRIGYIDFFSFTGGGTGSNTIFSPGSFPSSRSLPFNCDSASSLIYGLVEVRSGFTPLANQTFTFRLGIEQY